ncbi:MAG TPA: permease prefix domain 1-containing protein, partial [Terracidiphilus sp.]|nr:permease prefix domain 1-containing protein [Terracidiphilus sp.]
MRKLRAFWMRVLGMLRPGRADEDFETEVESHVALDTERGLRAGLTLQEARRRALIRLGGAEQTRQALRERRGLPWLESLFRDLRASLRALAKHPGVTVIAIVSIGLGIG